MPSLIQFLGQWKNFFFPSLNTIAHFETGFKGYAFTYVFFRI
jgi:hypothetical protein